MSRNRGQSTAEITVLFAVIIGALLTMQIYMKRAAMGKLRSAADQVGDQFSPYVTTSQYHNHYKANKDDVTTTQGLSTSTLTGQEVQERTGGQEHITQPLTDDKLF